MQPSSSNTSRPYSSSNNLMNMPTPKTINGPLRPGLTARTVLKRCWSGRKSGLNFDTAGLRAQNVENNRNQWRCFSGRPLKPALL